VVYAPVISEKEITNLDDGIWYFHVQFRNANGWGEVSHFRFQVDTQPPEPFAIKFTDDTKTENPQPTVIFNTKDSLSGVDYYKIKIGEGEFLSIATEEMKKDPYALPLQTPGKRSILIQAFDKADNYTTATEEFEILSIETPSIIEYSKKLQDGETLIIKGETKYPDVQINLWLQYEKDDPKDYSVKSDQDGKFTFIIGDKLSSGVYTAWVEVIDAGGARSNSSKKVTILVGQSTFLKISSRAVGLLAVIIPLVVLIFTLLFIIWYGWHKFRLFRKKLEKIRKEVHEAETALHKAFDLLKEDVYEQIKLLEKTRNKRQLTEEEEKIIKQLKKNLDDTEKFVRKEMEDIKKETE